MDLQVQMKKESDDEHLLSEMHSLDDLEGDNETYPIPQCGVLEQINKPAEHCTRQCDMDGHDNDHSSAEFANDGVGDIDIEESKDFFNDDFRLKHENATRYTLETGFNHGEDGGNMIENCRASESLGSTEDTPLKIYVRADLLQRESKVDLEQVEIKTKKSIQLYFNTDSIYFEKNEEKNRKILPKERVSEKFQIIKQEVIDKADISTPENINTNSLDSDNETDDSKILFFEGFETVGQNRLDILKLYNNFLSNELGRIDRPIKSDHHEELGCLGENEVRERKRFPQKRSKNNIQNIVEYCKNSREMSVAKGLGNLEQVEINECSNLKGEGKPEENGVEMKQRSVLRISSKHKKESNNSSMKIKDRTSDRLQLKSKQNNNNSKTFKCSSCNYKAPSNATLKIHMRFHKGERPYECKRCFKRFVVSNHLKRHMLSHSGVRDHVCVVCTKGFLLKSHLNEHMRKHTGARPYSCTLCPRTFAHPSNVKKHMKTHVGIEDSKPETLAKNTANQQFKCETSAKNIAKQPFKCETSAKNIAKQPFKSETSAKTIANQPFKCSICPKTYPYFSSLERHMTSHTGERKYECPDCSRRFSQLSTMQRHRSVHTKEKFYKCEFCTKSSTRISCVIKHTTNHHN